MISNKQNIEVTTETLYDNAFRQNIALFNNAILYSSFSTYILMNTKQ